MRTPIADAAAKSREWTERRNALIVQAHKDGASLRKLADLTGLSHTAIAKIVKRSGERTQP
jgi:lambda repressor-like predicted transcriptional regulator